MKKVNLLLGVLLLVVLALLVRRNLPNETGEISDAGPQPSKVADQESATLHSESSGPDQSNPESQQVGYLRRPPVSEEESRAAEPVFPPGFNEYSDWEEFEALPIPPPILAAFLQSMGDLDTLSESKRKALFEYFRDWGKAGDGNAIKFALEGLKGDARLDVALAAFDGWAEDDIAAAADYASTLTSGGSDYLVFAIPERYLAESLEGALDWAVHRSPQLYRNHVMQHTIIEWNRGNDGSDSAKWLATHLEGKDRLQIYEETAVREVVENLAQQDFNRARDFLSSLNSLEGQQVGVGVLIDHWANTDPAAAANWLEGIVSSAGNLATDGSYDDAYRVMAFRLVETDVAAAQKWADRISDDSDYESVVNRLSEKLKHSQ